jgi:hypothetical protein
MSLRILITNAWLSGRSGSELYVWDLATALLRRGHTPIVYSPVLGPLAAELRAATIPVVDDLSNVATVPDLIHGHHNHEIMTALCSFRACLLYASATGGGTSDRGRFHEFCASCVWVTP